MYTHLASAVFVFDVFHVKASVWVLSNARLAQLVERKALNLVVVGSSPTVGIFVTR